MKVYKLEVMIIDEDVDCIDEAESIINDTRYPNHICVNAVTCQEADIGEWDDDNLLNITGKQEAEMNRLFPAQK